MVIRSIVKAWEKEEETMIHVAAVSPTEAGREAASGFVPAYFPSTSPVPATTEAKA